MEEAAQWFESAVLYLEVCSKVKFNNLSVTGKLWARPDTRRLRRHSTVIQPLVSALVLSGVHP